MSKAAELAKAGETLTNQPSGRKNIVINGAMQVAQRATSVTGISANGYYTLDRFKIDNDASAGRFTMTQTADGPSGFANCLKLDCTTADTSIAAGEYLLIRQIFEGQDLQQLKKGTSDAESITVSFYVKGDQAATYVCELFDTDNSRTITQAFAVTTSWNRIILTFPGDTTGALADDNASSLSFNIWLHGGATFTGGTFANNTHASVTQANRNAGSRTSFFDSTDREFFITGVQMEIGSQATNFEHRSYGEELALCQRYFQDLCSGASGNPIANISYYSATSSHGHIKLGTEMNSIPTISVADVTHFIIYSAGAGNATSALIVGGTWSRKAIELNATTAASTAGHSAFMRTNNTAASIQLDAEL
jgi:hypothetical protein|tara:strand:+ start:518 stop:1609 length:1092 start_codon:yes stop_codon:yes gene_type:complete